MSAKLERTALPDGAPLRRLLAERADEIAGGATVVDSDAQGGTGVDLLLADERGRPVFVDVIGADAAEAPSRVFAHLEWLDQNRRLFTRAYAEAGIVKPEDPVFVFVAGAFPPAVVRSVGALDGVSVRLLRAEAFLVDGQEELLLEDVAPGPRRQGTRALPKSKEENSGGADRSAGASEIRSEEVRALLALFRSGVDGLDGRIRETRSNGGMSFELDGETLAFVTTSPVSFTVSPGDRLANPIVVSDRVSLERALNAVVSLFVREGERAPVGDVATSEKTELSEGDREQLAGIWGGGIAGSEAP
jgi:hypothetical protein